jgi:hypothetical protein
MRFIVDAADGQRAYNGTPKFEEGGVLRIVADDQNHATIWLSPAFWHEITEDVSYDPVKADYYLH